MGEAQADEHAAGDHAAPALGQAPQQRQQPVVDAREVRDRLHDHEPLGAARGALDERGEDLGPLGGPHGERLVDDRQPRVRQRRPLDGARQQDLGLAVVPRAQEVARAEQLGARVVADRGLADEQAVEHEQADRLAALVQRAPGRPRAARRVDRAHEEPLADLADPPRVEPPREIRVRFEKLYRAAARLWHAHTTSTGDPTPSPATPIAVPAWKSTVGLPGIEPRRLDHSGE